MKTESGPSGEGRARLFTRGWHRPQIDDTALGGGPATGACPPTPHPGGQDGPGSGHSQAPHICDVTGQLPHPDWAWSTSA